MKTSDSYEMKNLCGWSHSGNIYFKSTKGGHHKHDSCKIWVQLVY